MSGLGSKLPTYHLSNQFAERTASWLPWRSLIFGLVLGVAVVGGLQAQNIGVTSPFNTLGDSYYERNAVNFGFSFPNGTGPGSRVVGLFPNGQINPNGIVFNQGGFGAAVPPFGGFDPAAGARFGFGRVGGNGPNFSLGFELGKGSTRTATTQAPSVVIPNGGIGSFSTGQFSPFVTSVSPVVFGQGGMLPWRGPTTPSIFPAGGAPVHDYNIGRLNGGGASFVSDGLPRPSGLVEVDPRPSSAQTADLSVREILERKEMDARAEQQQQLEEDRAADKFLQLAKQEEANGNLKKAAYYLFKAERAALESRKSEFRVEYDRVNELIKSRKK